MAKNHDLHKKSVTIRDTEQIAKIEIMAMVSKDTDSSIVGKAIDEYFVNHYDIVEK